MSLAKIITARVEGLTVAEVAEKLGQDVAYQYREVLYAPQSEFDELAALLKPATKTTTKKEPA